MTVELRTERLLLRPLTAGDADAMHVLNADPEVMRFIGSGAPLAIEDTRARTAKAEAHWDAHGWGVFAAVETATGTLVGWSALATPHFLPEILPATELGWRVRRDRWGRGYAPEAARAVMGFAFGELGLDRLVSCIHSQNAASIRVAEKLGMVLERETTVPGFAVPCRVYERTA
ncbi:GNAT family N-acetyltransferase [Glycomyces albidus]|jgi:RimJ/RimL family protein N-acetyltransferase|uniref:GNAT family N-acetyltransferase n=1 Tax=Glycomyces albidus TaxID=2656774 RepID=A0A6L5G726_9ACTN|nr:GNAT family N-acetyltransferase [Glycomyces albidus]MQM25421.1 GNAT family N-acetyltransferase [Glycomyces albidus]